MKDKLFVDTNIWVYLFSDSVKSKPAALLIEEKFDQILISTQVLTELYNVLVKKNFKTKIGAGQIIDNLSQHFMVSGITPDMVSNAIEITNKFQFSIYDSLIISTALHNQCKTLFSEDMQHNQSIHGKLKIINPFYKE